MIRHLFTLMWNRKRANSLLMLEVLLAFVVLFAVSSLGVSLWGNYRTPLGFAYQQVWAIDISTPGLAGRAPRTEALQRIGQHLRATPGVLCVTRHAGNTPFANANNTGDVSTGTGPDRRVVEPVNYLDTGPELRELLGLHMQEGRWFDRRDEAANYRPVVITTDLRDALFAPGQSPLGQTIQGPKDWHETWRVVGVSGPYRPDGALHEPVPGVFLYASAQDTVHALNGLLVRVAPGAGAVLEKKITDDIRTLGAGWRGTINTLDEQRLSQLKVNLSLPVILGVVCLFLIVNVMLGLFGVLWLNINQRRAELGVRRALGATAAAVSRQVLGEILVLTTFGLVLGLLIAAQFPLLGVFNVKASVYLTAMAIAAAGLYLLAAGCALYPSRLAAGIQPAVALREE
ncbi:FtsX-like permease family protein [Hymenobacter sp. HMF4947]|uniref:FtsX-like permease family protein n=1 Tax=Hymenobacter ginkgonis TaxID=2682976 RepID=A0A7K1TLA8_9BACT|nr:ABC transporter permease [Hymenobacter ginkgonis]MVN79153.1 FtsX-like permease family protein [Hymenobacter ginkgonis]